MMQTATLGLLRPATATKRTTPVRIVLGHNDPQRRWALSTLLTWIGGHLEDVTDEFATTVDLYDGSDESRGRSAAVWIRPDDGAVDAIVGGALEATRPVMDCDAHVPASAGQPWPFDMIAAAAALLTCRDGETTPQRDAHNRVPDPATWIGRAGLEDRPVCQVWARWIAEGLRRAGWRGSGRPIWPNGKRWAAILTHDVDLPERHDAAGRWSLASALWQQGRPGGAIKQWIAACWALGQRIAGRVDPAWAFDDWMTFESSLGLRSTWAFLATTVDDPGGCRHDARYRVQSAQYRRLLYDLSDRGFELALHAAYQAGSNADAIRLQAVRLRRAAGVPITGVRHHFWRIDADAPWRSWRAHAAAGLKYDLSVSFSRRIGFRSGAGLPYAAFDPQRGDVLPLTVVPSTMMDASLVDGRTVDHAVEAGRRQMDLCRKWGLCAVLDWHARTWSDARDCPGYGDAARALYRHLARDPQVWVATAADVAAWCGATGPDAQHAAISFGRASALPAL
jgi:hypothetical protein